MAGALLATVMQLVVHVAPDDEGSNVGDPLRAGVSAAVVVSYLVLADEVQIVAADDNGALHLVSANHT